MSIELTKDLLKMEQIAGEGYAQALVEGDILVPDVKPDISRILSIDGSVDITNKEAAEDKIIVDGVVNFQILYVPDGGEYSVYGMDASASFNQSIDVPKTTRGMDIEVKGKIEHIEFDKINERKIGVKTVVNISGESREISEIDILKGMQGIENLQVLRESVIYQERIGSNQSIAIVREDFELDESMPEIQEILKCSVYAVEKEKQVVDEKVALSGLLKTNIIYVADDEDNSLHVLKYEIPFTHFVEVPEAQQNMDADITLKVKEVYTNVKKNLDEDKKILELEATVKVDATVNSIDGKEFIIDAYSPCCQLELEKEKIILDQTIGENTSNAIIKETLEVPTGQPNIGKIFDLSGSVILTDSILDDGKNMIEGIIIVTVLYTPQEDPSKAHSFSQEIPFRHSIEVEGVKSAMEAQTNLYIDDIDYNLINSDQVEIRINVGAYCIVTQKLETEILTNVEDSDEIIDVSKKPSITIYFVQPEDTLWKIAKRYCTTVEELTKANDMQDSNEIVPGERLFIQKNVFYKF
jgi:LysM repeat protein